MGKCNGLVSECTKCFLELRMRTGNNMCGIADGDSGTRYRHKKKYKILLSADVRYICICNFGCS